MYEISVKTHFDAAHRLVGYEGKCQNLHGHRWDVEVVFAGSVLNKIDMVADFKILKELVNLEMSYLDHKTVLKDCEENADLIKLLRTMTSNGVAVLVFEPTAEIIARSLYTEIAGKCRAATYRENPALTAVKVKEVTVWESPTSKATYKEGV